jgi:hypothetical protein
MNTPIISTNKRKLEFDKKLKQIEADELKLKNLEQELMRLQMRMAEESRPIVEEFCQLRFENLTKLKQFLSEDYFKKKEKRQMTHLMVELAVGLQGAGDSRAEAFLDELIPEEEEESGQEEEQERSHSHQYRPAPAAEKQAEGKVEIKSLFRQLAKAFHPDKEPLEHLKEEKTSLMKKITAAYENQDLYGLLKLEKEHLGPREFTEDKIELYIKHINDRLKELRSFEARLKKHGPLAAIYKFIYARKTTIQEYNIRNEISKVEDEVQREKEFQNIIWDRGTLRNYLKSFAHL